MNDPTQSGRVFARLSIVQAVAHLASAVAYALSTPFKLYMLGDYVSVSFLLLAALGVLNWAWGPGLLCGGWAFELSIYLRGVLARLQSALEGGATGEDQLLLQIFVLSAWLLVVTLGFGFSVKLCIRDARSRASASPNR